MSVLLVAFLALWIPVAFSKTALKLKTLNKLRKIKEGKN